MRLKLIAVFLFFAILAMMSTLAFAQEGGGKPLPGEGSATPTPTPTFTVTALAPATDEPDGDDPTEIATDVPTDVPTLPPDEPTEDNTTIEIDIEFPADMLEETGLDLEEGELVLYETFDEEDAWEIGSYDGGTMEIDDGVYVIDAEAGGVLWGQNQELHSDVVIQVTTEQLSDEDNNGFGIMCRAAPENNLDGYYLWISGDGYATIFLHDGEDFETLVEWTTIDAINQGQETNVITAVCVGEYLGLFVNDELAVETEDDTFVTGVTGLSVYMFEEDENAEIAFDDVVIWQLGDVQIPEEDPTEEARGLVVVPEDDIEDAAEELVDALEQGDVEIELGDILMADNFEEEGAWGLLDEDGTLIEVNDGVYFFEEESERLFSWGQNHDEEEYEDVVISIEAEQTSRDEETGYGLMCRLQTDDSGDGYTFLIGGDGYYTIGYWEDDEYVTLEEGNSDAVNQGEALNTIYVVCVGEYLALYANGELIDEVEDDTFESGVTGMAVVSFIDEPVVVEFDNVYVWEAND